ncbi:hypothetical protein M0802_007270 [Mischocyttarus mexicanus]|nr:hypothetical protein M0802_007270 [Mischocyttarus mexicanus]
MKLKSCGCCGGQGGVWGKPNNPLRVILRTKRKTSYLADVSSRLLIGKKSGLLLPPPPSPSPSPPPPPSPLPAIFPTVFPAPLPRDRYQPEKPAWSGRRLEKRAH